MRTRSQIIKKRRKSSRLLCTTSLQTYDIISQSISIVQTCKTGRGGRHELSTCLRNQEFPRRQVPNGINHFFSFTDGTARGGKARPRVGTQRLNSTPHLHSCFVFRPPKSHETISRALKSCCRHKMTYCSTRLCERPADTVCRERDTKSCNRLAVSHRQKDLVTRQSFATAARWAHTQHREPPPSPCFLGRKIGHMPLPPLPACQPDTVRAACPQQQLTDCSLALGRGGGVGRRMGEGSGATEGEVAHPVVLPPLYNHRQPPLLSRQ